jgi:DNA invertase Pin-like site-specific DNA recombinase
MEAKRINNAIIYCRVSRTNDDKTMSLDSQEYAIKHFNDDNNFGTFKILKDIGSAFNKPQTDLKNILKSCKNKTLIVYEANRLSRNLKNFKEIWDICVKNKHDIAIVNINTVFNHQISSNYEILYKLIKKAEDESRDMGRRISRTISYKKTLQISWGYSRDNTGKIVLNKIENKITKLILLLGNRGSSINDIKTLINQVGKTEGKDPFEIIEYGCEKEGLVNVYRETTINDYLPNGMSSKNIEDTLKIYEIRKRTSRWTVKDINLVLRSKSNSVIDNIITEDDLCDDLNDTTLNTNIPVNTNEVVITPDESKWISVWYDPTIGLPPNIKIPDKMVLPTIATLIYLPK